MLANNQTSESYREYNELPPAISMQREILVHSIFGVPQYAYTKMDATFEVVYENRKKIRLQSLTPDVQLTNEMETEIKLDVKRKVQLNLVRRVRVMHHVFCREGVEFSVITYTVTKINGEMFSFVSIPNKQDFYIHETFLRQLMTRWGTAVHH